MLRGQVQGSTSGVGAQWHSPPQSPCEGKLNHTARKGALPLDLCDPTIGHCCWGGSRAAGRRFSGNRPCHRTGTSSTGPGQHC